MKYGTLLLSIFAMSLSNTTICQADPGTNRAVSVAGLSKPVEILRDRWGIAHIYAQTEDDLFFAQGYNAARDRLFQLEIWRVQASGTAAKSFGRRELKRDIGARLHRYRGDLRRELNHYHPRGEAIINAFVKGINAYISETERDPKLLPIEFRLLGIRPLRWTADIVISRHQGLFYGAKWEVTMARVITELGEEKIRRLYDIQADKPVLTADPTVDLKMIPENVLDLYSAFRGPIAFAPEQVVTEQRNDPESYRKLVTQSVAASDFSLSLKPNNYVGSNNWVIHGSRTIGGHPIMANDPHRGITVPSLRYWIHLVGPGWNVIGAGEPALPGVSIGHNEYGAWGLTIFGNDFEDLYVYDTNPVDVNEYRFRGNWERMQIVQDSIQVKGEAAVHVEHKFTRHGPVLFEDKKGHKAYALRPAWMDIGGAPYLSSLRMDQSRSWEEFREACTFNYSPSESMVWADRKGNIGFQATGFKPIRRNWGGLLPVPGDGRYEWDGYLPIENLPNEHNPTRGYIATANNYLFPIDYRFPEAAHLIRSDAYRYARISEVLGSGRRFNVSEVMGLQNDELSIPARQLLPLLAELPFKGASEAARDLVFKWDFVLDKDSVAAGIYALWEHRLVQNFRNLVLTDEKQRALNINPQLSRVIDQLVAPDGLFGADPNANRDEFVLRSFNEAITELIERFGPDMQNWKYGQEKFQHVTIKHPLSSTVNPDLREQLDIGTAVRGGNDQTVNFLFSPPTPATAAGSNNSQSMGGTTKIIVDTAMWDRSVGQHAPGQSGNPDSPYYRNLFEMWAQGKYFPLLYSREMVQSSADERMLLTP